MSYTSNNSKMPEADLTFSEMERANEIAEAQEKVICLSGPTGHGKSSAMLVLAKIKGIPPVRLTWAEAVHPDCKGGVLFFDCGGTHEEVARGVEVPHHLGEGAYQMRSAPPEMSPTRAIIGDKPFLIVVDEAQLASANLLGVFRPALRAPTGSARFLGVHEVGRGVQFALTMNGREDDFETGKDLAQPDRARVNLYRFKCTLPDWLEYAKGAGYQKSAAFAYLDFWNRGAKRAEEGLCPWSGTVPNESPRYRGGSIACPRTWEDMARAYPDVHKVDIDDLAKHGPSFMHPRIVEDMVSLLTTVLKVGPEVTSIRNGSRMLSEFPEHERGPIVFAAVRIAIAEGSDDPHAALASGAWDWVLDLLMDAPAELGAFGVTALEAHTFIGKGENNPLQNHKHYRPLVGLPPAAADAV